MATRSSSAEKMQVEERLVGLDILEADLQHRIQRRGAKGVASLLAKSEKVRLKPRNKLTTSKTTRKNYVS